MLKTLRITSILAAIAGVGLFVFLGLYGFRGNPKIEQFLKSSCIIEEFRKTAGNRGLRDAEQSSPLIAQAGFFANIIDPPPPPIPTRVADARPKAIPTPAPVSVAPIFKVIATSFNESRPGESLALIEEPGKGAHWVRQDAQVAHLKIEIKDGLILAKSGETIQEMRVVQQPTMSLLMDSSALPGTGVQPVTPTTMPVSPGSGTGGPTYFPGASSGQPMTPEQEMAMAQQIFAELEAKASAGSKTTTAAQPVAETAPSGSTEAAADTGRITGTESDKIGSLGSELKTAVSARERAKLLRQQREERAKLLRERLEKARQNPQP